MNIKIGPSWVVTTLDSGREVHAHPTEDQVSTAVELGYGPDVVAMTRDHDPLHSLVARLVGAAESYALRDAAGELPAAERYLAELEEAAVMALQRFAQHAGRMPNVRAQFQAETSHEQ